MCVEDESKLRNRTNYEEDVNKKTEKNGIEEECVFHQVIGFHVTDNVIVDFMHDLLEGVCTYAMRNLVHTFIFEKEYFTLQTLNVRMQSFNFGSIGTFNKPPVIKMKRVLNNATLRMSAAEMLNFVRFFGVIMGDKIPENDKHWEIYMTLRKILDILLSPQIIREDAKILKSLVEKFNTLYRKYYGDLKPKFHLLTHYATILLNNGPVVNFWAMRFESNHCPIKNITLSTSCKINLLTTIATKQALRICEMINFLHFGKNIKFGTMSDTKDKKKYFSEQTSNDSSTFYKDVNIDAIQYEIGTFVVLNMEDSEFQFGKIIDIVALKDEVYFYMQVFDEITFDYHHHAYIVECKNENRMKKHKDLPKIAPVFSIIKDETHFLVMRYGL